MVSLKHIRSEFINYFHNNEHTIVPSSSLIPHNDPSLMFINSGMVQFKNVFTGLENRAYNKAVSSQKCIRAGGKHNDLENVGYTARHHTFFEMLGNFSFGDYFKEKSIYYSWNLLTKTLGIPKDKLYITIYYTDDEARDLWKKIAGLDDQRIIRIKSHDNFWSMGPTGPCGPCCEIFYDHGEKVFGGLPGTVHEDGDRYIEIWNMVFMQYEQVDQDTRIDLPKKSIDTGMGLERISAILQGVNDNYDIDLFKDLIAETVDLIGTKLDSTTKFSYRVIADHIRSCSFLIADGIVPSNEGRGYVLRRIIRRAVRHAHQIGAKEPIMYRLLKRLIALMSNEYPELERTQDCTATILLQEEERFKQTLDKGLKLLDQETVHMPKGSVLSGNTAFKLYDTYGFPLDLTEDILKSKNIKVNNDEFEVEMQAQKDRAKKAWQGSGASKDEEIWFKILNNNGPTEFLGYSHDQSASQIIALIQDGKEVDTISHNKQFVLLTNQTPFYGESGGQMGDIGFAKAANCKIRITDTKKHLGKLISHICVLEKGYVSANNKVQLTINREHRQNLRNNHSATHILHAVLKNILGSHVTQKGSLVAEKRLRFDITHNNALNSQMIGKIEDEVNRIILANYDVKTVLMPTDQAIKEGATALFGEKYDEEVRVVSMGDQGDADNQYSIELCGGTHVSNTGEIGIFKIISESAIGAGIRRIEAITGQEVIEYLRNKELLLNNISSMFKSTENELISKVESINQRKLELESELKQLRINELVISNADIDNIRVKSSNINIVGKEIKDTDPSIVRAALEVSVAKHSKLVAFYYINNDSKISLIISVSKDISNNISAKELIQTISLQMTGKQSGGGNNLIAQTGGFHKTDIYETIESIKAAL